jgi:hypothetical protein
MNPYPSEFKRDFSESHNHNVDNAHMNMIMIMHALMSDYKKHDKLFISRVKDLAWMMDTDAGSVHQITAVSLSLSQRSAARAMPMRCKNWRKVFSKT